METPVTIDEQRCLLHWARQAVVNAAAGRDAPEIPAAELTAGLLRPHAAFVTLTKDGELRGCIGRLDYARPLWQNLLAAAAAAALEDPRFPAVQPAEVPGLRLEISVLGAPREIPDATQFDPQRHGIIVEKGWHNALLLPQVARHHGWDAAQTLATVCGKAGLAPTAWQEPGIRLQVFEAQVFGEPGSE